MFVPRVREFTGPRQVPRQNQRRGSAQTTDVNTTTTESTGPANDGGLGSGARDVVASPLAVINAVARDIADTARRPEVIAYWAGLAGVTLLGAIEWPVAVAVGVGVAIARGTRAHNSERLA